MQPQNKQKPKKRPTTLGDLMERYLFVYDQRHGRMRDRDRRRKAAAEVVKAA